MDIIFMLIGCSVIIALFFLGAFFWAAKNGQHEDTYTPSVRILFDDELTDKDTEMTEKKA
ncbi:cbb3-type cytochrome oxidase assembly protein CcoS [Sphingobacterium sp. DK4209]|uniref:Cbb3-type cytochrome oxidase assembly protein CcoS n=1 Tax=Sphingobacterium zhuxiongii TaxID=2662364 RepID=A0A5Q0QAP1_9SPHI|nr:MULTISPECIES: cbb3-type cytochrome oxidase assembly protein CcoS [unclassified Sphingobacterium]MVZ67553.1 cbb3-type cytochrome oxidase assembly protein CcoS [Sphingobacterium sp. DK4209]QGA27197.1 cbb3-type cytochrome oxidase assembly protein CcoS [Sphingobacterium sp. dk4302]